MGRWFGLGAKSVSAVEVAPAPLPAPPGGLALRLDNQGRVVQLAGSLSGQLAPRALLSALGDWLSPTCARGLPADLGDCLGQPLDLDLLSAAGAPLAVRGWLQAEGDGWLLLAQGVDDLLAQVRNQELRLHFQAQAGELAERLRHARAERLAEVMAELLADLAQRWQIPSLALALPQEEGGWRVYAHHSAFRTANPWAGALALGDELDGVAAEVQNLPAGCTGLRARLAHASAFLVPYQESGGVAAWLLCVGDQPAFQAALRQQDWLQLLAQVAGTLLQRLREQQERHERQRLGALQGLLGAGWWEYLPASGELQLAPALAGLLGQQQATLALEDWLALIHPADRDEFRVRLGSAGAGEWVQCLRLQVPGADTPGWYRMQAQLQGSGKQARVCGFLLDIGDIKQQEALAAAAHARLSNLVASAPAVIYVQAYAEGALQLQFCSDSLGPLLGWSLAELQGGLLAELVHPEDHEIFFSRSRQLLRDGAASARYRLRDRQGRYHWLLDESKLLRDELGQPREAVGLWLDVSEATEAAERIRASEERYRILVEDSPAMICRYHPDLTLMFANRPLADYLECTPEQLVGANLGRWLSAEQRQAFDQRLLGLSPEQPLSTAEICLQLPGRTHAWWIWADRGVFDEQGRLLEVQAVGRDNTEVRKAQQQLFQGAKMATLGEMATGMAHEMNQPLNVMRMAVANVLKRLANGEATPDYLQDKLLRIESQVQRAARLVDHMRVFGRRSEVEQQLFDPRQAVEGALSLLAEGLAGKGIDLQLQLLDAPLQVRGFADQLEQVLINLLVNARDALLARKQEHPDFVPRIQLRNEHDTREVRLLVEDNGGGIDPRLLERIFEPFFTTKEVGKGTGLGLSVSYGIVQQMGGHLGVDNVAEGACFCIALPLHAGVA